MTGRITGPLRRHPWRAASVALLLVFLGVNAVAFVQAWAMTHFVGGGDRTASPERLTRLQEVGILFTGVRVPRPANARTPAAVGLPFATRHVASDGLDLEAWAVPAAADNAHGRGRAVVLMYHGYSTAKSSLLSAAVACHGLGCDVEMVDFRGSGSSGGNVTSIGYREADDVAATVADARRWRPGEPVVLLGQSMGAAAALRAVGDLHCPADGLLLESPYDRLLSTADNRFASMHLPAFPMARLLVFWGGVQQGYWAFGLNPADSAAGVRCPAVVFQGGRDPRVTMAQARSVYDALGGPKQFEVFPTAGHCGFREADPARWRRTVDAFLAGLADGPRQATTGR